MTNKPRILFIGHEALSDSGAAVALCYLIEWLKINTDFEMELILLRGGDMLDRYRALIPTRVLWRSPSAPFWKPKTFLSRAPWIMLRAFYEVLEMMIINIQCKWWKRQTQHGSFDVVYFNCILALDAIPLFKDKGNAIVVHLHDMAYALETYTSIKAFADTQRTAAHFIAASDPVRHALEDRNIPTHKISVIPSCLHTIPDLKMSLTHAKQVRTNLNIPEEAIVIGMCGQAYWRKGVDLFFVLARSILESDLGNRCHFLWIGTRTANNFLAHWKEAYAISPALQSHIHFPGKKENALDYIAAMDIFTLTSREDPIPLAALEAGALAKPIICFDENAGGTAQWVGTEGGFVIPYLDMQTMAKKVSELIQNPTLRTQMGERNRKIVTKQYTMDSMGAEMANVLRSMSES
ncbi:MAG: glycosyltransferase family 4 protein [Kiritimatiellales bacterium]|nr:glycosyltransferase family 4 protein [Kiritimatiellales bacterium]